MKKNRIGKKCNMGNMLGRKKRMRKSHSFSHEVISTTVINNEKIRRAKKLAQKKAATERAAKNKNINKIYFINVDIFSSCEYSCGCIDNYFEKSYEKFIYASSIEDALKQIAYPEDCDLQDVDFVDLTNDEEYYCKEREYADVILCASIYIDKKHVVDYICKECEKHKEEEEEKLERSFIDTEAEKIINSFSADNLFNMYVYAHGVYAYNHTGGIDIIPKRLNSILTKGDSMTICCSWKSQPIGPVGIYTKGSVTMVSNTDLNSFIDGNGKRVFYSNMSLLDKGVSAIVNTPDKLDFTIHNHCEIFLENPDVVGIWIKEWFLNPENKSVLDSIYKIAKENCLAIHIVKARRKE